MGYTEEQHNKYGIMMSKFDRYEKIRKSLLWSKCPVHKKRVKISSSWESDYEVHIYISNGCCSEFAKQIANAFEDENSFDKIIIQ